MKILPLRFALRHRRDEAVGLGGGQRAREAVGEILDRGPIRLRRQRHDDMDALAARQQRKADQPEFGELVLQMLRGALGIAEVEPLVGVEIEHQPVGLFERIDPRSPAVEFDRPHLDAGDRPSASST